MSRKFAGLTKSKEKADKRATARTTGRRNDPDYLQTTIYLPRSLHKEIKIALAEDERELSAIAEELFSEWLKTRKRA